MVDYRPILKGAYSITEKNSRDIFGENEFIDNVHQVILIEIPAIQGFRVGSTRFEDAFIADSKEHMFYQAELQLMCRTLGQVRRAINAKRKENIAGLEDGDPIEMVLETVIANESNPLLEPLQFGSTADSIRNRPFMRNVLDNIDVLAYRLWAFIRHNDPTIDYSQLFFESIDEASKAYDRYEFGGSRGDSTEVASMSSFNGSSESSRYGTTIADNEKWKLLRSRKLHADALDLMLGLRKYTKRAALERILSPKITVATNPTNPIYAMSPYAYFQYPTDNLLESQTNLANYQATADGRRWKMARGDLAVRIWPDDQSYERLSKKFFPDYQVRSIGDELIDEQSRCNRIRASKHYERKKIGSDNNELLMRNMRRQELDFGEAGDIDLTMPMDSSSIIDGAIDPMSDELLMSSSSSVSSASSINSNGPRFVESRAATGGNSPAEIIAMLASAPEFDDNGNYELYDASTLAREDYEGAGSLSAQKFLSATDLPTRSDFHLLRHLGANFRSRLFDRIASEERNGESTDRESNLRSYLGIQNRIIRDYNNLCMSKSSKISHTGLLLNEWFENREYEDRVQLMPEKEQLWLGVNEPLFDPSMSVFGNMVARRMLRLESSVFVTSTHSVILTLLFGTLDAYRHEFDLHFNALLTGPNSTGKSFICEKIGELRVRDTVTKVDTSTSNAGYVDTDHNDQIVYTEELKPSSFRDRAKGGNDDDEAKLKEFLTSMTRTKVVFHTDPSGRRGQRVSHSQQITSRLECTNILPHHLSAPILSRYSLYPVEMQRRIDRETSHMTGVKKRLGVAAKERYAMFRDELACEQYLHYHTEKLLACYALSEPTLGAYNSIMQVFGKYLEDHHNIHVHPRTFQRAAILARQFTISLALEYLFSNPYSKYYKIPFCINYLRDLDPLLRDTEEIAYCALDAIRHEIIDGKRPVVIRLIKTTFIDHELSRIFDEAASIDVESRMRSVYMMPGTKFVSSRYGSDNDLGSTASGFQSSSRKRNFINSNSIVHNTEVSSSSMPTDGMNLISILAGDKFSPEYMYAYYRVDGGWFDVASRIAVVSTSTNTPINVDAVREVMREMSKSYIVSARYRWDTANFRAVPDERFKKIKIPALIYTHNCVFVAIEAMSECDPVSEAIAYCQSRGLEGTHKYATLIPLDSDHPYLLQTRTVTSANKPAHMVVDYANQMTASTVFGYSTLSRLEESSRPVLTSGARRLKHHYNECSRRERAITLFLDPDDPTVCSFDAYENYCREALDVNDPQCEFLSKRHVSKTTCDYPHGIIHMDAKCADAHLFQRIEKVTAPKDTNSLFSERTRNKVVIPSPHPPVPDIDDDDENELEPPNQKKSRIDIDYEDINHDDDDDDDDEPKQKKSRIDIDYEDIEHDDDDDDEPKQKKSRIDNECESIEQNDNVDDVIVSKQTNSINIDDNSLDEVEMGTMSDDDEDDDDDESEHAVPSSSDEEEEKEDYDDDDDDNDESEHAVPSSSDEEEEKEEESENAVPWSSEELSY